MYGGLRRRAAGESASCVPSAMRRLAAGARHHATVNLRSAKPRTFPVGFADLTLTDLHALDALIRERTYSRTIRAGDMQADTVDDLCDVSRRGLRRLRIITTSPSVAVLCSGLRPGVMGFGDESSNRLAREVSDWLLARPQRQALRFAPFVLTAYMASFAAAALLIVIFGPREFAPAAAISGLTNTGFMLLLFVFRQRAGYLRVVVDPREERQARRDWVRDVVLVLFSTALAYLVLRLTTR